MLRRAVELGVNFIDTADSYGPEVSENLIAEALHPYPDELLIATKAGLPARRPRQVARLRRPRAPALGGGGQPAAAQARPDRPAAAAPDRPDSRWRTSSARSPTSATRARSPTSACRRSPSTSSTRPRRSPRSPRCRTSTTSRTAAPRTCSRPASERGIGFIPWFPLAAGDLLRDGSPLEEIAERHDATAGADRAGLAPGALGGHAADPGHLARSTTWRTTWRPPGIELSDEEVAELEDAA